MRQLRLGKVKCHTSLKPVARPLCLQSPRCFHYVAARREKEERKEGQKADGREERRFILNDFK